MNYVDTFITVAEDCPVRHSVVPEPRGGVLHEAAGLPAVLAARAAVRLGRPQRCLRARRTRPGRSRPSTAASLPIPR